ncbi:MAG TPA: outer membrane protein assembly factor BamD [Steroidobacteraceae bacterium]|nr:outer membrane protein assembly factor BamD [Steroidobacteraceae bacterium]
MPSAPLRRALALSALCVAFLATAGCGAFGWGKEDDERLAKDSPEQIYQDARKDLRNGNYPNAIARYELLEARYPFSDQAKQGQLDLLYAYYRNRAGESAVDQADQFIRENPTHPRVDYAHYIRGLVYFESGLSWLERVFKADLAQRPPSEARKSFQAFQTLVQQFPKSPYAADARQRMVYLRNRLADYEVEVARFYLKRGAYIGAANRARGVIEGYDGAPAIDDALKILAQSYRALGVDDLAQVADNVRRTNVAPDLPVTAVAGTGAATSGTASSGEASEDNGWRLGAPEQAGRWEATVGVVSSGSTDVDFEGGTTATIDSSVGFVAGAGYHFTDRLRFGSTFTYDQKDYTADVVGEDPDNPYPIEGSLDTMSLMLDVGYTFLTGPLTPYVSGGVGWAWVDTNVATEAPEVGCWWHPWWGYICTSWQDTRTVDGLAYELGLGVRYNFSDYLAADGAYRMRWIDFDSATSTPSFDTLLLNLVWKF